MKKLAIIYWSGSGNTQIMAESILEGANESCSDVDLFEVNEVDESVVDKYEVLALGCPSMGAEVLEESEFEPFMESIDDKIDSKKIALFGSYGWGDGEWMVDWEQRINENGAELVDDGLIINETPDDEGIELCKELGRKLV